MSRRALPQALPSPSALSSPEILGSPFQLRKLLHRHSDPQFSDVDLFDAVEMGEHVAWANLDEPIYAEKDFEIYRPPQQQSSLPVYYVKGWLPYSADTLFNTIADVRYRHQWDKLAKQAIELDTHHERGSDVVYFAVHLPWPFANRDYVYQRRTKFFAKQSAFVMISQAVQHAHAPPESSGVVRVETFTMRLSIRSTGTSSCDFYMEYEDDTNFSIPNYMVNWLLSVHVPSFMNELRKACATYPSYLKTLDDAAVSPTTPASVARWRAEESQRRHVGGDSRDPPGMIGSPSSALQRTEPNSSSSTAEQLRRSAHVNNLQRKMKSSSSSSDRETRRGLEPHSEGDGHSDSELTSSTDQTRKGRKFFQRNPRAKEKEVSSDSSVATRSGLKKARSMNKLFSSSKTFTFRPSPSSSTIVSEEFVVEFRKLKIGLHLETDLHSNHIFVAHCERNSEAASASSGPIRVGMVVTSVNGTAVGSSPSRKVLETIKNAPRPLSLGFSHAPSPSGTPKKAKKPQNVLRCVFAREDHDLLRVFRPLDDGTNSGAVLKTQFEGKSDSCSRLSPRARLKSPHGQPTAVVLIPEGAVLHEIDHCLVVNMPFAEIVHLLSRNADAKTLTFKPSIAIVGDREREDAKRRGLSKAISSVFRWKSSDDSVFASPSSKTTPSTNGFKSTGTTETSSVQSGDLPSDPENEILEDRDGSASSRRSGSKICLPDYSRVAITTRNIAWAWEHVHLLKADERVFSAAMLVEKMEAFMMKEHGSSNDVESTTVKTIFNKMHEKRDWIEQIKERRSLGVRALHEFNNEEEADWTFGQTYFGVSTHWKPGADGTVWLKLDGLVEGVDIFNTIAVMREIDLFSRWVPFCNESLLLQKTGFVDVLVYISMLFPLLKRDAIIRAVGINACYESRCILLLGGSVDDATLPSDIDVPRLKGWNAERLEMRAFRVLIEPITRTKGRTCIVCNIEPKCAIPKSLLNFAIKKVAGVLLFLLRKEAEKIEKAMQDGTLSDHVTRLKDDPDGFYAWLRPLFDRWFTDQQANGLPPPLKFPRASELDVLHEMNRSTSMASMGGASSFGSRSSSRDSTSLDSSSPSNAGALRRAISQSRLQDANGDLTTVAAVVAAPFETTSHLAGTRTWVDYLYDFGIWPYFLLFIFSRVTAEDHFLYVCLLKLLFTCTCTWFGVPGAYSWQTRQLKRARRELDTLRRRCVLLAAMYDLCNSWLLRIWVNWLLCYAMLSPSTTATCMVRTPVEIRESENFWLVASAFSFASMVVGIQVAVNI